MSTPAPVRLIPRWYTVVVVTVLAVATLLVAGLSFGADGLMGWSAWGLVAAFGLLLVAATSALARRRRPHEPEVRAEGVRVFEAPAATTWPLLGAWLAALTVAAIWGYVALTDFGALESPGFALVTVAGAVASLPDLARLLTGRLHRWRLELGQESLTYRGYRTDVTVPWSEVRGAKIQERGPAGVLVEVRGDRKDPVLPITAFAVPAEQLVQEVQRAKAATRC